MMPDQTIVFTCIMHGRLLTSQSDHTESCTSSERCGACAVCILGRLCECGRIQLCGFVLQNMHMRVGKVAVNFQLIRKF